MLNRDILIADADAGLRMALPPVLARRGYRSRAVASTAALRSALAAQATDLLLLDPALADEPQTALYAWLRAAAVPFMLLSTRDAIDARLAGLAAGAEDYLVKPVDVEEVGARIKAVLRLAGAPVAAAGDHYLPFRGWKLDTRSAELLAADGSCHHLPVSDYRVLLALLDARNRILGRDALYRQAFGRPASAGDRALDVCISRLRRRLGDDARRPMLIRTVRNEGYMLHADDGAAERSGG